jgi:hypothetical protein
MAQLIWLALIIAQAAVLYFAFRLYQQRRTQVAVLPQFVAPLAELTAALASVSKSASALKDAADSAPSAQDLADTVAAVQAQADAAKTFAAVIAPSAVSPPVIS